MSELLQRSQYCGRKGNTIFDTVAAVRDIIAYIEVHNVSVCLLTLDLKEAFDRIYHVYLYAILREYSFSEKSCTRLQRIYASAISTLIINGVRSQPIPIQSSVRQGCPMGMFLFVTCLNQLHPAREKKLTVIKVGRGTKTTLIAYADHVTIIVSKPEDIRIIKETLRIYEEATGAKETPENRTRSPWTRGTHRQRSWTGHIVRK
jgi:hypothetical protein